jgi:hypothetical protein
MSRCSYADSSSELCEGEWSTHAPSSALPAGWNISIHSVGGWLGLRAGLDSFGEGKLLASTEIQTSDHPASS